MVELSLKLNHHWYSWLIFLDVIFASHLFELLVLGSEMNFACSAFAFLKQNTHSSFFFLLLSYTISLCLIFLKHSASISLSLSDNECRNSPSCVFSSAWRLVLAHGPLIINLTLCASRLIIPTYLYDSLLTSSPGLCFFSLSLSLLFFSKRLVVLKMLQLRVWAKNLHHQN